MRIRLRTTALAIAALATFPLFAGVVVAKTPSYDDYATVLTKFVNDDGLVDYAGLKADRESLDAFVKSIASLDRTLYESWTDNDKLAFWLNAYNALVLRTIVDNYPIQPQQGRSTYPANSIQQIPGIWDQKTYTVMGREQTLDKIENDVIRKEFHEPRIHMALVCGALSCPRLRREPYRGATLDAQLNDQARMFLSDLRNFFVDREHGEVWASSIFKWFVEDFAPGVFEHADRPTAQKKALLAFVPEYVPTEDADYLRTGTYVLQYFDYDWTLNEQVK